MPPPEGPGYSPDYSFLEDAEGPFTDQSEGEAAPDIESSDDESEGVPSLFGPAMPVTQMMMSCHIMH